MATLIVGGCVALDRQTFTEQVDRAATQAFSITFVSRAIYRSKGELLGSEDLAQALGVQAVGAEKVVVSFSPQEGLSLQFLSGATVSAVKKFTAAQGVRLSDEGKIVVPAIYQCGGHDSPGWGCWSRAATLYLNTAGQLVCIESGGALGTVGLLPVAMYTQLMSIYARATGDPDIDNIPTIK